MSSWTKGKRLPGISNWPFNNFLLIFFIKKIFSTIRKRKKKTKQIIQRFMKKNQKIKRKILHKKRKKKKIYHENEKKTTIKVSNESIWYSMNVSLNFFHIFLVLGLMRKWVLINVEIKKTLLLFSSELFLFFWVSSSCYQEEREGSKNKMEKMRAKINMICKQQQRNSFIFEMLIFDNHFDIQQRAKEIRSSVYCPWFRESWGREYIIWFFRRELRWMWEDILIYGRCDLDGKFILCKWRESLKFGKNHEISIFSIFVIL